MKTDTCDKTKELARALGLPEDTDWRECIGYLKGRLARPALPELAPRTPAEPWTTLGLVSDPWPRDRPQHKLLVDLLKEAAKLDEVTMPKVLRIFCAGETPRYA